MPAEVAAKTTVDPDEVKYFNELSTHWWEEMGAMKTLHAMSKLIVPYLRDEIIKANNVNVVDKSKPLKGLNILEVGCGGGLMTEPLARTGCSLVAIDITPELLNVAIQHSALNPSLSNITYKLEAVEDHAKEHEEQYDVVVANFVLEHVNDHELFLQSCMRCLRPGGSFYVSAIGKTLMGWMGAIVIPEKILKFIPCGMHTYNKFITAKDTKRILEKYKCKSKITRGIYFNVVANNWFWINGDSMFYTIFGVKE